MSEALYGKGGLRFYTEDEIETREAAIRTLKLALTNALTDLNSAWTFHRVEGPLLTPRQYIHPNYTDEDIFVLNAKLGEDTAALRAETTASSYLYAKHLIQKGLKVPTCIWQVGKSFRQEQVDGARASTLRYNEFYQAEFQFIYKDTTKADIRGCAEQAALEAIKRITRARDARMVDSDRLPDYATETRDVEVPYRGKWKEMASISTRTDFPMEGMIVLEVAVGLDRLIAVEQEPDNYAGLDGGVSQYAD